MSTQNPPPLKSTCSSDSSTDDESASTATISTDVANIFSRLQTDAARVATLFRETEARNRDLEMSMQNLTRTNEDLRNKLNRSDGRLNIAQRHLKRRA